MREWLYWDGGDDAGDGDSDRNNDDDDSDDDDDADDDDGDDEDADEDDDDDVQAQIIQVLMCLAQGSCTDCCILTQVHVQIAAPY